MSTSHDPLGACGWNYQGWGPVPQPGQPIRETPHVSLQCGRHPGNYLNVSIDMDVEEMIHLLDNHGSCSR